MLVSFISIIDFFARRSFAAAGLRSQSISLNSQTTIHLWLPRNPNPKSPKPALLLLHGFGPLTTLQWRRQIQTLSLHFHLIVPDLLFFGGSATTSPERSEESQAAAMAELLRALGLVEGLAAIVGTSYGGFVAYHLARMLGGEWKGKVVIASSDLGKGEEDDRDLVERVGGIRSVDEIMLPRNTGDLRKLLKISIHRPPRFLPEFLLRDVIQNLYKDNLERKMELIKGVTLGNKDLFQLTPLQQDVLILWGEHDNIFPVNKAFQLKKKLGEKARLEILKNTGHVPQAEDPDAFNKALLGFLLGSSDSSL